MCVSVEMFYLHTEFNFLALNVILKTIHPEQLIKIDGLNEILKGLIPYTGIVTAELVFQL